MGKFDNNGKKSAEKQSEGKGITEIAATNNCQESPRWKLSSGGSEKSQTAGKENNLGSAKRRKHGKMKTVETTEVKRKRRNKETADKSRTLKKQ